MNLLKDKIAFITGGSRGIGAAIVLQFAKEGATIGFSYHTNKAAAEELLAIAAPFCPKIKAYTCDVRQPESVAETMAAFIAEFGGIDVLVNNAGIIQDNLIGLMPFEDWTNVLSTNLTSAFLHTQSALPNMVAARRGSIINISSVAGLRGNSGQANYAASKAGLIGLTKSVAKEVGRRNIRCNAIAPGIIETDMTADILSARTPSERGGDESIKKNIPLRRFGGVDDIAHLAVYLASDLSTYITGQVISVCGGLSL